ncbi:MAG TPA: hypothetical protein VIF15_18765 [Polyangiaceae bacterium]|jgi:colicin import membrane protein
MSQSSSVMFSLQELSRMEEERVRTLEEESARERAMRERSEREAEQRARSEREAHARAEEEARREVERRAREEAARIEAIHRAAVEAARAAAEARVHADERERARRHELELEQARVSARPGGAKGAAMAAAFGAVVAAGVAMALHFGVVAPREQARAAQASAEIASRDVTLTELRARADATEARVRSLEDDLAAARTANGELRADLAAATRTPPPRSGGWHGQAGPPRNDVPHLDGFTTCPPGSKDPLCLH